MGHRRRLLWASAGVYAVGSGLLVSAWNEWNRDWSGGLPRIVIAGLAFAIVGGAALAAPLLWGTGPPGRWRPPGFRVLWGACFVVIGTVPFIPAERQWPGGPVLKVEYWSAFGIYVKSAEFLCKGRARLEDCWPVMPILIGLHAAVSAGVAGLLAGGVALAERGLPHSVAEPGAESDSIVDYDDRIPADPGVVSGQ